MVNTSSVWHIDEVSEDARKAAIQAAKDKNVSLGTWLAEVINKAATLDEEQSLQNNHNLTSIERAMLRTVKNQK